MNALNHPEKQRLADYAVGKLAEVEATDVARHLSECPDCESTIQALEQKSDTLVGGLREQRAEPYSNETELKQAAANLANLPLRAKPQAADQAEKSEMASTKAPVKLGPYQLLAKLGEGGMGAVFKARHEHLDKIVAIKVLPKKAMQDPAAVARFRREMKAVGALHHPNIVGAHDAGEQQGVHFLVMEYAEGSDLSSLIKKNGPVTVEQAISYILQTAKGLAFAHSKNIVHRDIKPANLLVDSEGTVKILDMGLARLDDGGAGNTEANQGLTQTGQVMGTVDYMAPEQAFDTSRADAKADVYSLGCTLYRILTGENAYRGETVVQKILAHREQPIPSLAKVCPTVPAALDALYRRMMAKRPEERPTMAEVVKELDSLADVGGRTSEAGPSIVIDTAKDKLAASLATRSPVRTPGAKSQTKNEPGAPATGGKRGNKPPMKLIAGGIGGFALLVSFGVWLIVRDKGGNEIGRVPLPEGATMSVSSEPRTSATGVSSRSAPQSQTPVAHAPGSPKTLLPALAAPHKTLADPAFQAWLKSTQALPAEKQLEAVSKKLMELNPGFDGKLTESAYGAKNSPKIEKGVVVDLGFNTDHVENIAPLRALSGLRKLNCSGSIPRKGRVADLSPLAGLPLTNLICAETQVADLSPLNGMPLKGLACNNTQVADLTPLAGMSLGDVRIFDTGISDLTPLKGMKLSLLYCYRTPVSDLSPLAGMPLIALNCSDSQVSDLTPLKGMQLPSLWFHDTLVTDVTPLEGMPLKSLRFTPARITRGIEVLREMMSLVDLGLNHATSGAGVYKPAEFWKKYDVGEFAKSSASTKLAYLDPAFQQWVEATQKLSAEQQLEAVSKKLMELNPGFDGKLTGRRNTPLPNVVNGVVTEVGFATDRVTDISPVRALTGLIGLACWGEKAMSGTLTDLSPLTGLPLRGLNINSNKNLSDLAPLRGMQLTSFESNYTSVTDFTVLQGMPLSYLHTGNAVVADLSFVRGMPLEIFYTTGTFTDLSPLAGMPLRHLAMRSSQVTDLSPLKGMPLGRLGVDNSPVSDLSPLAECKELTMVFAKKTQVTAAGVAALQKALPNCKIDWDDPTKTSVKPLAYLDPAFQQWVEATQKLPAEQQLEAVNKKLLELNPGFDGVFTGYSRKDAPKIENGVVTELGFITDNVTDLSPVRALTGLQTLGCGGTSPSSGKLSDLSPLGGMPLTKLTFGSSQVSDLTALRGMPLTRLEFHYSQVSDLSPLAGMPLDYLNCGGSPHLSDLSPLKETTLTNLICSNCKEIASLAPLRGMRLTSLACSLTQVADLSPLADCKDLKSLSVSKTKVTAEQVASLQKALPDCKITWEDTAKTPDKPLSYLDPKFQEWVEATQKLPAEQQLEAVSKKLIELNPGFDGKLQGFDGQWGSAAGVPTISNGVVTKIGFHADHVTDISPVRALTGLTQLSCRSSTGDVSPLSDLSPLKGMKLIFLGCANTKVSDLSPLEGMPLTRLWCGGKSDLSDLTPLHGLPLTMLSCRSEPVTDLSPLRGMPLTFLDLTFCKVSDLSPLKDLPLTNLVCVVTPVSDLSPLEGCWSLKSLEVGKTKVTAEQVAALQKALPDCKITWDDPAKPAAQQPTQPATIPETAAPATK